MVCYYCNNDILLENRTLEHREPLNKGGFHTKDNCVMACKSCNSSKQDKTENEFINYNLKVNESKSITV